MQKETLERAAAILSLLLLLLAWAGGRARVEESVAARIRNISPEITALSPVTDSLYRGERREIPGAPLHIALESRPSYGGPLGVAVVADAKGEIRQVAILHSTDTSTYLRKVVESGVLDPFPGSRTGALPHVDAISGATISSTAILEGIRQASARIEAARVGAPAPTVGKTGPMTRDDGIRSATVALLFGCALFVAGRRFPWSKKKGRALLMVASTLVLGFLFGGQFSLGTVHLLLSGGWMRGVASHAALICLLLAVAVFFLTRKNLYCATLCPFGAVQEGLGRITGCSPPKRTPGMAWTVRLVTLSALAAALFFRNPSEASFEPFGMAFNFTGSDALFAMTLAIAVGSLVVKRPWCRLFCPVTAVFDFFTFARNQGRGCVRGPKSPKETP